MFRFSFVKEEKTNIIFFGHIVYYKKAYFIGPI